MEKIDLIENEEFITEIMDVHSKEELQRILVANGIDLNSEEVDIIFKVLSEEIKNYDEALSLDDLDHISGGGKVEAIIRRLIITIREYRGTPGIKPRRPRKKRY